MGELERYLEVLTGPDPGPRLLEIRYRREVGMGQEFVPATHMRHAAKLIRGLAFRRDVFCGVLLRDRPAGGRDAVSATHLVWIELDGWAAVQLLERAPAPPTMTIASGTPGHLHAYWQLQQPVSAERAQAANRKLALRVAADLQSVDAARILRPPETVNHKHDPPRPVRLLTLRPGLNYDVEALTVGLDDPRDAKPAAAGRDPAADLARRLGARRDDTIYERLRAIPIGEYVARLAGRTPNREGKIACPFHEDRTPSLQCYPDGSFCCFGCGRGGTIVDFAAALWCMGTKGRDFLAVRDRLADELLDVDRPVIAPTQASARCVARPRKTATKEELAR